MEVSFPEPKALTSLDQAIAYLHSENGHAPTNRFEVMIFPPPKLSGAPTTNPSFGSTRRIDSRMLSYRCESVSLPGRSLNQVEDINIYGPSRQIVKGVTYAGDASLTFIASGGLDERVFFEGMSPFSLRLLKEIDQERNQDDPDSNPKNEGKCFYIIENTHSKKKQNHFFSKGNARLNTFLTDPNIKFNWNIREIRYDVKNFMLYYLVFEYEPAKESECYQNSLNYFSVRPQTRKLLRHAKSLSLESKPVAIKEIFSEEKYNTNK